MQFNIHIPKLQISQDLLY